MYYSFDKDGKVTGRTVTLDAATKYAEEHPEEVVQPLGGLSEERAVLALEWELDRIKTGRCEQTDIDPTGRVIEQQIVDTNREGRPVVIRADGVFLPVDLNGAGGFLALANLIDKKRAEGTLKATLCTCGTVRVY